MQTALKCRCWDTECIRYPLQNVKLDQAESLFFSHYDPDTVKWLTRLGR